MAFNPFHSFRKYQKVVFAFLAILCMVLFVLSVGSGAGLMEQFFDLFGRGRARAQDSVATLDGKRIDGQKIEYTRRSRKLANEFISMVVSAAHGKILASAVEQMNSLDSVVQQTIQQFMFLMERGGQLNPGQFFSMLGNIQSRLIQHRAVVESGTAINKKDQLALIQNMILLIDHQRTRFERAVISPRDSYFGGDPDKIEDTLDFLVWKSEADRLGIKIENVTNNNNIEMLNQSLRPEILSQIEMRLKQEFGDFFSIERLNQALADEYRVRLAKASLAGEHGATRTALPVEPTPDELYDWFRDVRTTVKTGLIEVPVAKFLDKVTEQPTEAQLKELFDKHKNDEYNPELERPGFKDPRKVKVEWLAAPSEAGFYKQAAEQVAGPLFQAMRQFGSAAVPMADGTSLAPLAAILGLHPAVAEARNTFHYLDYVGAEPSWLDPYGFGRRSGIHDSSVNRPENIATLVGSTLGGLATQAGPFVGPLAFESRVVAREVRDRVKIGASILMAATLDPAPLGIDALALHLVPTRPSESALRAELVNRDRDRLAGSLLRYDLQKFREELRTRAKEQDTNNVQAYINEFIHARQFNRGGTADAVDRFALPTDPGVQPLRTAYDKMGRRRDDPLGERFAHELADNGPGNDFMPLPPENYATDNIDGDGIVYVHWRSEDRSPKVVPFDQAKPRVEAAWKFQKARELAKKEAERIETEAKNAQGDIQKLRDLAAQTGPRGLIELDPMAVWNSQVSFTAGAGTNYVPPEIPQTKVSYPGSMATQLVGLRKPDASPAIVVSDMPKAHFYVGTLLSKDVPSTDAFRMAYKHWQDPAMLRDPLFDIYVGERQRKYKTDFMTQLRADHKLEISPQKDREPTEG